MIAAALEGLKFDGEEGKEDSPLSALMPVNPAAGATYVDAFFDSLFFWHDRIIDHSPDRLLRANSVLGSMEKTERNRYLARLKPETLRILLSAALQNQK